MGRVHIFFIIVILGSLVSGCANHNPRPETKLKSDDMSTLKDKCRDQNVTACYFLGYGYEKGIGLRKSYFRAGKLYMYSCNKGVYPACSRLGNLYFRAKGVRRNLKKSFSYFRQGCQNGDSFGCYMIGKLYAKGNYAVPKNINSALKFYMKACYDKKYPEAKACNAMGLLHLGEESFVDLEKSFKYFSRSCKLNDGEGCYNAGTMYLDGVGRKVDKQKAQTYFKKACDLGLKVACATSEN